VLINIYLQLARVTMLTMVGTQLVLMMFVLMLHVN